MSRHHDSTRPRRRRLMGEIGLLLVAVAVALTVTVVSPSASRSDPLFTPAIIGGQPPGAVVLASRDRDLAVALAVQPTGRRLLLVVTVLGQDGTGISDLGVSLQVHTADGQFTNLAAQGGAFGCYTVQTTVADRPTSVAVTVTGPGAGATPVRFALPATWPASSAVELLQRAEHAYSGLRSLVTHEELASGRRNSQTTTYWAKAPTTLRVLTGAGFETILIGNTRWDRTGAAKPWQSSTQRPTTSIKPYWEGQTEDAKLLGSATIHGRPSWIVSFAAPQMPAFFTIWIDKSTGRTLELRMTAAAHFMHHTYGPFDAPVEIQKPR